MEFRDITNLIWGDEVEKFKELVSQDFDYYLGLEDHRGVSLFYHVINSKNLELFKFLVENGADVNFLDKGDVSPIYLAAQRHSLDIFEYLFDLDVDLDTFPKYANHGVIGELCTDPEAEILLKRFIDKVDTINYKDLARVLIMEKMKLAKYIIENKNPDPVIITSSIKDLLYHDNNEVIEFLDYLLKNEFIDVNDKSIDNESIFQMVINKAEDNVVAKYLVENGIDLNIDNNGINALFSMASKNCL